MQIKSILFLLFFVLRSTVTDAQKKDEADNLVSAGVDLQDKGQPDSAIVLYRHALQLDKDNLLALAEMAYTLLSTEKYEDCISYSKKALKTHPHEPGLKSVYVSYGNALDEMGKTARSIEIYDEGINQFPEYYHLYYNKAVSLNKLQKTDDAILTAQRSVSLNPDHASSNNMLGRLLFSSNKIASLLAFCRFLILEPGSNRSEDNFKNIQKLMHSHVTKTDEKKVTIHVNSDLLSTKKEKNNFSSAEFMLTLNAALDDDSANADKTAAEKFIRKFTSLCTYLKETEKDNYGFYWDYYVPYFTEMNDKGFVPTFAYIAFSSSGTQDVKDWQNIHKTEMADFYKWSEDFKWRIN